MQQLFNYGDRPGELGDHLHGGNQQIRLDTGLAFVGLIGDSDTLSGHARGGDDDLTAFGRTAVVYGDAQLVTDHARGGDDRVWAGGEQGATAYGDAQTLSGHAWGGDDYVTASAGFASIARGFGDAGTITDHAHGGNDTLTGFTAHGATYLYGDAFTMTLFAQGGDDSLSSTDSVAYLYGDADSMSGHAAGGADTLAGGGGHALNHLYGDARVLQGDALGGDDVLIGGSKADINGPAAFNWLYGDGEALLGRARGGDDTLIGGANNADQMWGDAVTVASTAHTGADLFVFAPQTGHDQIMDFEPGKDRIEFDGFGWGGFHDVTSHVTDTADGVLIRFDAADDILLRGVTSSQLSATDFVFG